MNLQRLAILLLPAITMTTTANVYGAVDVIELRNNDNEIVKTLDVNEFDGDLEALLEAIAEEISDTSTTAKENKDSNEGESSSSGGGGGSSSNNCCDSNNGDFEQVMESAAEAYDETMKKYETEGIPEDDSITPTSQTQQPINNVVSAAAAAASGSSSAAAAAYSIPEFPGLEEPIEEEPEQPNNDGSDGTNEGDGSDGGQSGDGSAE